MIHKKNHELDFDEYNLSLEAYPFNHCVIQPQTDAEQQQYLSVPTVKNREQSENLDQELPFSAIQPSAEPTNYTNYDVLEEVGCKSCTFLNPVSSSTCSMCNAEL